MNLKNMSIKSKMMLYITVGITILLTVAGAVIVSSTTTLAHDAAYGETTQLVSSHANNVDGDLVEYLTISKTLGNTLTEQSSADRDDMNAVLEKLLVENENLLGTFVAYEPNAFDGNDAAYVNAEGHDSTGRFVPYWNTLSGGVRVDPLVDYDTSDYYQLPKSTKMDLITEPYLYEGRMLISFVSPLMVNGKFIGITGVDAALDYLDERLEGVKVLDTGYIFIVSNEGVMMTHPENKDWIGTQNIKDFNTPEFTRMAKDISNGNSGYIDEIDSVSGKEVTYFYEPIETGNYAVIGKIQNDEMMAEANALRNKMILIFMLSIIIMAGISYLIARSISKPIIKLEEAAKKVADGDYSVEITKESNDEVGQLSDAMATMVSNIKDANVKTDGMLKGIVDPMFVADTDLTITYFNEAAEKATGYRADEVIGKMRCADVIRSPLCGTSGCAINTCMSTKDIIQGEETTIISRDGQTIPVSISCAAMFDAQGNAIGGIEIARDIAEIKNIVNSVVQVAGDARDGDLTARANVAATGDYKKLVDGVNDLLDVVVLPLKDVKLSAMKLAATSEQMSASTEQMTSASTQISDTVGEISSGAQTQSAKSQEVARAMNDMTLSVQEVAVNAQKTAERTKSANEELQVVGKNAEDVLDKMDRIKVAVDGSADVIQALDEKSKQIGEIVNLITNIADQTNLLALNAAIEAARAGEHGRGFAVVADEVRKLAEDSGNAAKQIANLITEIQGGTADAVSSMQVGTDEVEAGVLSVSGVVTAIQEIVTSSAGLTKMAQEIAAASEEQSASIEEVTASVEEVSSISEQSAAGSEQASAAVEEQTSSTHELASSAQELSAMAAGLQDAVSRFKLDTTEGMR